jgi:hypothetical protein
MLRKSETVFEKIIYYMLIYILPIAYALYVDYTKCFPYSFARWLWKDTRYQNSNQIHLGFLYGAGLVGCGLLYMLSEYLFIKKKSNTNET